jgi:tRNA(Ile)-lysidine synthase
MANFSLLLLAKAIGGILDTIITDMNISVQPGTYVVAVSGGVDSMVLLDLLRQQPELKLVVAHFDHGMRHDSSIDKDIVKQTAQKHGLPFVYHEAQLGPSTSEDIARKARYEFLHKVREASGARAIITAHHHDDLLETAVINMLRGTGRKGLSSLKSHHTIHRPLLHIEKQALKDYANDQGLEWREDVTNQDTKYLRNYVRHHILSNFSDGDRQKLRHIINRATEINDELDTQLMNFMHVQTEAGKLDRHTFLRLPHAVAREVMAAWLRHHNIRNFDQRTIERLVVRAKTLTPGKVTDVNKGYNMAVTKMYLALKGLDR